MYFKLILLLTQFVLGSVFLSACQAPSSPISNPGLTSRPESAITPSAQPFSPELAQRLARTRVFMEQWDQDERQRLGAPRVENGVLFQLQQDDQSPLRTAAEIRDFQFARRTVLFDVRRAAKFLEIMRPEIPAPLAGDMSAADGSTPADRWGLRHPAGAHVAGVSADMTYPGPLGGMPANLSELDLEATAWQMYSLLQSPAIESIYTAYKAPLLTQAEDWYAAGLIGFEALTRFRNDLWQDTSLNHSSHLHINSAARPGLLLAPTNDFYRCFSATVGSFGTVWSRHAGC